MTTPHQIDRNAALQHLAALGYQEGDRLYLRAIWSGKNRAHKIECDFPHLPWKRLEALQSEGYGIYFVVNGQGHEDADIEAGRAVFYEHDDLDKAIQQELWQSLGLPEPTIQIDTGGKSIHSYWLLDEPVEIGYWVELQTALLNYSDGDRTLKNPSRVMRLAGFIHQKTGQQSTIVSQSGLAASYAELWGLCHLPTESAEPEPKLAPTAATVGGIPLENCLSLGDRNLIADGAGEGQRNNLGAKLARALIGTENYLRSEGVSYSGSAQQLFDAYCARCSPPLDAKEAGQIWRSAESSNPTPTLTPDYLESCIKGWEKRQSQQSASNGNGKAANPQHVAETEAFQADEGDSIPRMVREYNLLRDVLGQRLRLNALINQIEIDGKAIAIERLKLEIAIKHKIYLKSSREDVHDMICLLAEDNSYNPVVEYLDSCYERYGGDTSIIEGMAERYFGQSAPIYQSFVKRTLIAAVARAYDPGCQHDSALVLQGKQGAGKSSFFRVLSNGWFDDSLGAISDKDERLKLHQVWFVEWGEIEAIFRRKDIATAKSFLTSQRDLVRPPYGRTIRDMPRRSIIVGSTNLDEFLSDPTGNRRFWVVPVLKPVDLKRLEIERERIWAAAVALYRAGESWELSPAEKQTAAAIAEEYQTRDPWQDIIKPYVEHMPTITTKEILNDVLKIEPGRQDKQQLMRVADCLRVMGWKRKFSHYRGKRQWIWEAPPEPDLPDLPQTEVDTEVDTYSNGHGESVPANPDPRYPPFDDNLPKTSNGHAGEPIQPKTGDFSDLGRSGGYRGYNSDAERVSNDPPRYPPQIGRSPLRVGDKAKTPLGVGEIKTIEADGSCYAEGEDFCGRFVLEQIEKLEAEEWQEQAFTNGS